MQRLGFIHDMMDVKVLVLFVMARVSYPINIQQLYELCFQDECLSYFDICTAVPEMVESGHLRELEDQTYEITDKGRADGALTEDSVAYTAHLFSITVYLTFLYLLCILKMRKTQYIAVGAATCRPLRSEYNLCS